MFDLLYLRPQFYYFYYKLHRIIMTYYIGHKKADNFKISVSSEAYLLFVPHPFYLRLLYLSYRSFVAYFICVFNFIIFVISYME